jgi:hypothetical protein
LEERAYYEIGRLQQRPSVSVLPAPLKMQPFRGKKHLVTPNREKCCLSRHACCGDPPHTRSHRDVLLNPHFPRLARRSKYASLIVVPAGPGAKNQKRAGPDAKKEKNGRGREQITDEEEGKR